MYRVIRFFQKKMKHVTFFKKNCNVSRESQSQEFNIRVFDT